MKFSPILIGCFALLVMTTVAFAAKTEPAAASSTPPAAPVPTPAKKTAPAADAVADPEGALPAPQPQGIDEPPCTLKFDDYLGELAAALHLTTKQKQEVADDYLADGQQLQHVLHDDSLSPLQKADQVAKIRDIRNAKILAMFLDIDRKQAFLKVEAKYRVGLTDLAADGGLVPVDAATPAPAPAPVAPAPASAAPADKGAAK